MPGGLLGTGGDPPPPSSMRCFRQQGDILALPVFTAPTADDVSYLAMTAYNTLAGAQANLWQGHVVTRLSGAMSCTCPLSDCLNSLCRCAFASRSL